MVVGRDDSVTQRNTVHDSYRDHFQPPDLASLEVQARLYLFVQFFPPSNKELCQFLLFSNHVMQLTKIFFFTQTTNKFFLILQ